MIRFLRDYRGKATGEVFYKKDDLATVPDPQYCIDAGAAEAVEPKPAPKPKPVPKPSTRRTRKAK